MIDLGIVGPLFSLVVKDGRLGIVEDATAVIAQGAGCYCNNDIKLKKEPTCSWVEIANAVHMFVANDDAHPQREDIRKIWEKLSKKIKEVGYVPDTSHVLLFVDQQEREVKLRITAEKLALAFQCFSIHPPGSTIHIKRT
ncbi:hypothetical protein IFM89_038415 [Coptis chinensis]|uniref:Uncharacterized protein n=1 Tax=Coptis chinensis TaxID=261450 RepID=A0A835H7V7_9MAGN|nr:hypothetical protein IFM89_038415 [Coptis chinensis]